MPWCKVYISSLNKRFLFSFIIILFYLILYHFWLSEMPELFSGANKIGTFMFPFLIAYITSFIFYFITVHVPKATQAYYIENVIYSSIEVVVEYSKVVARKLEEAFDIKFQDALPTEKELMLLEGKGVVKTQNWAAIRLGGILSLRDEINLILMNESLFPEEAFRILLLSNSGFIRNSFRYILEDQIKNNKKECYNLDLDQIILI